jgi:putative membrane protein
MDYACGVILWLKAFHVVFVITWFAGLFYLPRLFVYHAAAVDEVSLQRFRVMERRLLALMTVGAIFAGSLGVAMVALVPDYLRTDWLRAKLVLVTALVIYHCWCGRLAGQFGKISAIEPTPPHTPLWFRWFNEIPSALLIAIVVLAIVKPG